MAKSTAVVKHLPITQARINLGQLAKRAYRGGEYFILEKDGIPVIGIMSADELEDYLELKDPKVRSIIKKSTAEHLAGKSRPVAVLLAELQSERSTRKVRRQRK